MDWEHPQNALEGADFIHLLAAVRAFLPPPYLVTSALPAGQWALRHINLHIASEYLDFINVMCYVRPSSEKVEGYAHSCIRTSLGRGLTLQVINLSYLHQIIRAIQKRKHPATLLSSIFVRVAYLLISFSWEYLSMDALFSELLG